MVLEHLISIFPESPLRDYAEVLKDQSSELARLTEALLKSSDHVSSARVYLHMVRAQLYKIAELTEQAFKDLTEVESNYIRSSDVQDGLLLVDEPFMPCPAPFEAHCKSAVIPMSVGQTISDTSIRPFTVTAGSVSILSGAPTATSLYDRLPVFLNHVTSEFPDQSGMFVQISPGLVCKIRLLPPIASTMDSNRNRCCRNGCLLYTSDAADDM
jgi:hypothetical protein